MPLIAHSFLESIDLLKNASKLFNERCVSCISANEDVCRTHVANSTATVTALVPAIGYDRCSEIVKLAETKGLSIKEAALKSGHLSVEEFEQLITPEAVCRLGN